MPLLRYVHMVRGFRSRRVPRTPVVGSPLTLADPYDLPIPGTLADALRLRLVSGVEIQCLKAVGTIPGVVVLAAAARNGPGQAKLRSTGDGRVLSWQAPGSSTFGPSHTITANGVHVLEDGEDPDKFVRIRVYLAHLTAGLSTAVVHLADVYENQVSNDDVTAAEAAAGDVETHIIYLRNTSVGYLYNVKAWIDPTASGSDVLEISKDGVAWYAPDSETHPDVLTWTLMSNSTTQLLRGRRTIGAATSSAPAVLNLLHFSWDR